MVAAEPRTVVDVQELLRSRRARTWAFSVAATILMAAVASSDVVAILVVIPSLILGVLLLLRVDENPNRVLVGLTALVGLPTLLWSALTGASPAGAVAVAVAAGVVIDSRTVRRITWAVVAACVVAALSATAFTTGSPDALGTVLQLTFVASIWLSTILDMGSERRLFALLEEAKDAEGELSLARERQRFAADLHDIQGHTLHVIKLKAAVAAKLRLTDPERVAHELEAIGQLTAHAIRATRELAADRHVLSFSEELQSAHDLLDAAGVTLTVHRPEGSPDAVHDATLARVLREATTNMLRHANPDQVSVQVGKSHLKVVNDGAPTLEEPSELSGLQTLQHRLHANDGNVDIEHAAGTFTLTARLPRAKT